MFTIRAARRIRKVDASIKDGSVALFNLKRVMHILGFS
jgi:hypothetical protein